jgi:glutamate-1-semialdehyde 2,1-aminomutase
MGKRSFSKSEEFLERAEKTIPIGSQTFSKSRTQYPIGISPFFIHKAKGAKVWDIDGNKYVDLVNALASITIGYRNPKIDSAVKKQLKRGSIFSLPGTLEAEVAELIVDYVPSAEMVRFGKNGSDATSAAIRLARAYTGREEIIYCGYHGWQDWYIGATTRNKGVPNSVSALIHSFEYNNLDSLVKVFEERSNKIAAVIMEPMTSTFPNPGFLQSVKEITHKNDAILIFDETITGFRFSRGGAQEYFGINPDLTTLGKGIANGYPLSAITGKREIMMEMENIFFSGTFGGELLSLAAAKAVLELHSDSGVTEELSSIGSKISSGVTDSITTHKLSEAFQVLGHPTWNFLIWRDFQNIDANLLKTFFMQEMFSRGVLVLGTHNVSVALKQADINKILQSYNEVLSDMSDALRLGNLICRLKVKPLEPLFKIR